jgi:hypothetical protein
MKIETFLLVLFVFLFSGCMPMISKYYSIEPKSPSINVLREGHSQVPGLENLKLMPTIYELDRGFYKVYFNTDLTRRQPTIFISAVSKKSGTALFVKRGAHGECGGFYDVNRLFRSIDGKVKVLSYEWNPSAYCPNQDQYNKAKVLEFFVFNEDDNPTSESIEFELRYNGWSIVNDAI